MPQIINTNIASINAQRNLDKSQGENQTALQRLSSGLRINSARDDAAGLAISTRFTAQVQGLAVAIRNAGDGVSLAQVAEGALGSMTDNLLRIRDLALQAANATNGLQDRVALNEEVQQLKAEIIRVVEQTQFNGNKLLDGTFSDITFQIGANEGEDVSFGIEGTAINQLGTSPEDGISSSPGNTGTTPPVAALAAGDLVINGIAIGASSGIDDAFSSANNEMSAIAKAAAINASAEETGVTATVQGTFVDGNAYTSADVDGTILINGISVQVVTDAALSESVNLNAVAESINSKSGQTGVTAIYNDNPNEGIQLIAEDGRNVVLTDGTATTAAVGLANGAAAPGVTYVGSYTLISDDGSPIDIDTTTGDIVNAGLAVGTFSGSNSGVVSNPSPAAALASGDIVINGVPVGPSLSTYDTASITNPEQSAISKAEAINRVSDQTGVTAIVNNNIINGGSLTIGANAGSFDINGVTINISIGASDTITDVQNAMITAVNNKAGQSGVRAEAFGATYRLIAEDGRNITLANYVGITSANLGLPLAGTTQGSITLESAGQISIETLTGNIANSGFEIGMYGSGEDGMLVKDIDITTVAGALDALDAVDNAMNTINLQRANLGAIQNRFESTIQNQQIASENMQASNSRIRDADFAAETAELSRTQVLQQAGLSILTQANAQPQNVLQLLQ
jgi:flagellin